MIHKERLQRHRMEAKVRGLVYNEWYLFEIRAQTAMGWGEPAHATLLVTNERCEFFMIDLTYCSL